MNQHPDCTVIACSCDKYADLLGPFLTLFRKFWSDCPFELVLITESEPALAGPERFDRTIGCGSGLRWPQILARALDRISTPYVLMLLDDYFLCGKVDSAQILRRLEDMKRFQAANLRLIPNPKPSAFNTVGRKGDLYEYRKNTAYCIATQTGFWDRGFLKHLAESVACIWDFERCGSFLVADDPRPLLVTPTKEFPFLDTVHKGYWEKFGIACLKDNGIAYDFTKRGLPPLSIRLKEFLKGVIFRIVPTTWLVRVQNRLNLGAKEHASP